MDQDLLDKKNIHRFNIKIICLDYDGNYVTNLKYPSIISFTYTTADKLQKKNDYLHQIIADTSDK